MANIPYFDQKQVKQALKYEELIPAIEDVLAKFSKKSNVDQPLRATTNVEHDGFLSAMPAFVGPPYSTLACKLVSVFPKNSEKGLSSHFATVLLFDETTGMLKATMDGEVITAMRTAAVSVVATKHLALYTEVLAVIGSGVQAQHHVEAFLHAFPFKKVNVWNHRKSGAENLIKNFSNMPAIQFQVFDTIENCIEEADVIVCATLASEPLLFNTPMKPWVHINSVGAPRPHLQEISPQVMKDSIVYVDSYVSAASESGDIIKSGATVYAEIGEVILNSKEACKKQRTIFKSLGMAIEDAVSAHLVHKNLSINH